VASNPDEEFRVLEFHFTKSMTTFQWAFWKKFNKSPLCANSNHLIQVEVATLLLCQKLFS
jgi:hypothetical protein